MCILCHCGNDGDKFLSAFAQARAAIKAAKSAMLQCSKTALHPTTRAPYPEARTQYDAIHKQIVRFLHVWNAIEHQREAIESSTTVPEGHSRQAPVSDPVHAVPDSLYQQPDPVSGSTGDVLPLVMADYEVRMRYYAGPDQYGVPLRIDNLRDHLRDAYAEALVLPGYLKSAMVLWDEMRAALQEIGRLTESSQCSTELLRLKLQSILNLAAPYQ